MPTREDMQSLGQEMVGSYEARVAGIACIREEAEAGRRATQTWLLEVDKAHRVMARQQRADLTTSVVTQLKQIDDAHQVMARQQRADLAQGRADLTTSVATQLKQIGDAHQVMARQQRADLVKGRTDLVSGVATQLKEVETAHQVMARQQRADLDRGRSDLTQAEDQRKTEVTAWMKEVAAAHAAAQAAWQELSATMAAKRAGGVSVAEARAPAADEGEEEAVAWAEVGVVTPEFASLTDTVLEHLADHPEGIRLTELEAEFGMNRFEAARVVRRLMDEGRTEKRALLYFAI